jgi:hypothetical protein
MRGLARPGHVLLLHGYCPYCLKGHPGRSGASWRREDEVDKEQVRLSREGNNVQPLDMARPGKPCKPKQMCRMTCMVCGKSMANGDEPKFKKLATILENFESQALEIDEQVDMQLLANTMKKDLSIKRAKVLSVHGMSWIDAWSRPVHTRCAKTTPCRCTVPVSATTCPTHARTLSRPKPVIQKAPKPAARTPEPIPQMPAPPMRTSVSKASWLQKPREMASTASTFRASPTQEPPSKKRKPPPQKPNLRLLAAAATCRKIDATLNTTPAVDPPKGEEKPYDLEWHEANFDPWKHGDFWKGGRMWYTRPDGKIVPSFEGVRQFTAEGLLVPG